MSTNMQEVGKAVIQENGPIILVWTDIQAEDNTRPKMTSGEEIMDECTIRRDDKGNVYLQFIMQIMQDLTRILCCIKVKDCPSYRAE